MSLYSKRGVSAQKEEVHTAIKGLDQGLFPGAFCKIFPDMAGDPEYVMTMHTDGAGTKQGLGYLAMIQKDLSPERIWRGIAQDSFVMNMDDLLCVGATGPFMVSMSIDRNKHLISGEVIGYIIDECQQLCEYFTSIGIPCFYVSGETADVGDVVRTIVVNNTFTARFKKVDVIDASTIKAPAVIVGFSSTGKASWEDLENSGIGSNGFTNARHDVLSSDYRKYTETYAPETDINIIYCGDHHLSESLPGRGAFSIVSALLSPTRTYAPIVLDLFKEVGRKNIHGLIHCSGGGQTKIGKFGRPGIQYVKDNLFKPMGFFKFMKELGTLSPKELYQTYNMGHRLEAVVPNQSVANECIAISKSHGVDAQIVGYVAERPSGRGVRIETPEKTSIQYDFE